MGSLFRISGLKFKSDRVLNIALTSALLPFPEQVVAPLRDGEMIKNRIEGITVVDFVGYVARVDGISMQPALNPDKNSTDYVFLNRLAVKSYEVQRGDIVSLVSPKDPNQKIIKRIVGIAGDIVSTISYKHSVIKIPEGHCWIEGDHTGHSMDSNNFGPVSVGLITAKASCIVWPPSRWQLIQTSLPRSRVPLNLQKAVF